MRTKPGVLLLIMTLMMLLQASAANAQETFTSGDYQYTLDAVSHNISIAQFPPRLVQIPSLMVHTRVALPFKVAFI
jgi:hypothetical protein